MKIFGVADENGRRAILASLTQPARNGFLEYAADMAVLAVRAQSPELVRQGLLALVIEGGAQDWRDSLVALAKLYHSAETLGMNAHEALADAARLAEPGTIRTEMKRFPLRRPEDRDLTAFLLQEEITEQGFGYKQVLPWEKGGEKSDPALPDFPE